MIRSGLSFLFLQKISVHRKKQKTANAGKRRSRYVKTPTYVRNVQRTDAESRFLDLQRQYYWYTARCADSTPPGV